MKNFVDKYTWDEFQLVEDIRKALRATRIDRFSGNYQPYQIKTLNAFYVCGCGALINGNDVSIDYHLQTLKFAYAVQVWEIAQNLTEKNFFGYEEHKWAKQDSSVRDVIFTNKNRKQAEEYFYKAMQDICNSEMISICERATFRTMEFPKWNNKDLVFDIIVNADEILDEIKKAVYPDFLRNEKPLNFDGKHYKFSFDEIKDFFVYCDEHLLSLLNAEDGRDIISEAEEKLFRAAEKRDLQTMLDAINDGADINAIDKDGETAFTKAIESLRYVTDENTLNDDFIEKENETIFLAQKLLELGADVNLFGHWGTNALMEIAYAKNPKIMKFLLDNGANPNINFHPEDGMYWINSSVYDEIAYNYDDNTEEEALRETECLKLLQEAGAKDNSRIE